MLAAAIQFLILGTSAATAIFAGIEVNAPTMTI